MSKRRSQIDTGLSSQGSLFDSGGSEGLFDVLLGLKQLMSKQITTSGQDRYDIAASVSRMTLRDMSKDMLDKLTSSDPAYEPGVLKLAAFCVSTGSFAPFSYVLNVVNRDVIDPANRDLLRLAQLAEQKRTIELEMQQIQVKRGIK